MDSIPHTPQSSFLGSIGSGIVSAGKTFLTRTKQVFGKNLPKDLSFQQKKLSEAGRRKLQVGTVLVAGGGAILLASLAGGIPIASSTFGAGAAILAVGIVGGLAVLGVGLILTWWGHSQMKEAAASVQEQPPHQPPLMPPENREIPHAPPPGLHPGVPPRGGPPVAPPKSFAGKPIAEIRQNFHNEFGEVMVRRENGQEITAEQMIDELYQGRADLAKACLLDMGDNPDFHQIMVKYDRCINPKDNEPQHASVGYFFQALSPQTPALQQALTQARNEENAHPSIAPNQHPLRIRGKEQEEVRRNLLALDRLDLCDDNNVERTKTIIGGHAQGEDIIQKIETVFKEAAPFGLAMFAEKIDGNRLTDVDLVMLNNCADKDWDGLSDMSPDQADVSPKLYALWDEELALRREARGRGGR